MEIEGRPGSRDYSDELIQCKLRISEVFSQSKEGACVASSLLNANFLLDCQNAAKLVKEKMGDEFDLSF